MESEYGPRIVRRREAVTLSPEDMHFLYGADGPRGEDMGPLYQRLIRDSGAADVLATVGVHVDEWPTSTVAIAMEPDEGDKIDIVAVMANMFREKWETDRLFERSSNRWLKVPDRVSGYVTSDVGAIRWAVLRERMFKGGYIPTDADQMQAQANLTDVMGACATYMSTPHFIPAHLALDIATAQPLPAAARAELRLPYRYVMVFHDGVPVSAATSSDAELDEWPGGALLNDTTLVIGAILLADGDDNTLDTQAAYLILARRGPDGMYGWNMITARYGDHAAGRLLYNYAGLLNWEDWTAPPELSGDRVSMSKRKQTVLARTPEALAGGWHGTRVLNYTAPPDDTAEPPEPRGEAHGHGRQRKHSGYRRGFWKSRIRRGIEGEDGKFVGPVYGPDAVLGETYVYKRGYVRGGPTRADLPPPPGETVYRIPSGIERKSS